MTVIRQHRSIIGWQSLSWITLLGLALTLHGVKKWNNLTHFVNSTQATKNIVWMTHRYLLHRESWQKSISMRYLTDKAMSHSSTVSENADKITGQTWNNWDIQLLCSSKVLTKHKLAGFISLVCPMFNSQKCLQIIRGESWRVGNL